MDTREPSLRTLVFLAIIVVVWGANWPLMKLVLDDVPPLTFTAIRVAGALVPIGLYLALRGLPLLPARDERLGLAWVGLFQIVVLLSVNMLGLQFIAPGRAAILAYTMPLWAIGLGYWLLGERPGRLKLCGGVIGVVGLIVFFDPRLVDWGDGRALIGNGLSLLGAVSWALGSVLYRRRRWRSGFWSQIFWQILVSVVPLALLALYFESGRTIYWNGRVLFILAFNWLLGTGLAYWCWSRVLASMPAATAGQVVMLSPVLAFALSALFFGEPITLHVVASVAIIFLGLFLTMRGSRA